MNTLTNYERQFADRHHDAVYRFLRMKKLPINEYYDVVIFRYLGAVQRYLSEPDLQRYAFETIAFGAMRSALGHHFEAEKRKRAFCITDTSLVESLIGHAPEDDDVHSSTLLWMEVAALLTETEKNLVNRRANGWTYKEIAKDDGLSAGAVCNLMGKIRKRIRGHFNIEVTISGIFD